MKLQVVSDVHVEFHADHGIEWASTLNAGECDALVIAGDFGTPITWQHSMKVICNRFTNVIYVTGNHEYYGSNFAAVHDALGEFTCEFNNFHWLNNDVIEVCGKRILGTTMWFEKTPHTHRTEWMMNDFRMIDDAQCDIYDANKCATKFLQDNIQAGDIVVTHHLPSPKLVSKRFEKNQLNAFFVCDMSKLIASSRPALWIHGHTHDSKDMMLHDTRVVCNPFGYVATELNSGYEEPKIVEV